MNAISRRDFAAGLGGITLAFTFAPRLAVAQQRAQQQGSPAASAATACSMPGFASAPTATPPSVPARSSSARAS